jgi:hypothetical protein
MAGKTPLRKRSFAFETLEFEYNWTDWGCKFVRIKQTESRCDRQLIRTMILPSHGHSPQKTCAFAVYDVDLDDANRD